MIVRIMALPSVVTLMLCWVPSSLPAQQPSTPLSRGEASLPEILGLSPFDAESHPVPVCTAQISSRPEWFRELRFDYTGLPGDSKTDFYVQDIELSGTFALPWHSGLAPLLLTPGAAVHAWNRHASADVPGAGVLPGQLYDLTLDIGWKERLAPWLFVDLGVTPGLYTDFKEVNASSFRPHGRGLGILALSESWQLVGGVMYVNRNHVKILPAGGVLWSPSEDTRCQLVFPAPKIAQRLATCGSTSMWAYVAGEFGGGAWTYERPGGLPDLVDYSDGRLLGGVEWDTANGVKGKVEIGWVLNRQITFGSPAPEVHPGGTFLLRAGLRY